MSDVVERWRLAALAALIIFLPLSAWLVSWSGNYLISLSRDFLLLVFLIVSVIDWRFYRQPTPIVWLALIFIGLVLMSFFHRQDSVSQWFRGVRFLTEPLALFSLLQIFPLKSGYRVLWNALAAALVIVVIGGLLEYFYPQSIHSTIGQIGRGYLGQIHFAGGFVRLQSFLAGPNALGLFLMIGLLLLPVWQRFVPTWLAVATGLVGLTELLLTFSRSSYVGFFAAVIVLLVVAREALGSYWKYLTAATLIGIVIIAGLFVWRPQALTRDQSNTIRLEQYQRVWQERGEIGFWGRGAGAAGLSSVERLDNGPNFFTENTYLDAYEAVGILAALSYLAFWAVLIWFLVAGGRSLERLSVGVAVLALAGAGMFINHYTGQAAVWLGLLFAGVVLVENKTPNV